jgi:hypothetical protein
MLPDWVTWSWVGQQIAGAIVGEIFLSIVATIGLAAAIRNGFGRLSTFREALGFSVPIFVVSLVFVHALLATAPELHPEINFVAYGGENPNEKEKVSYVALAVSIANTGLPSIANGWTVEATLDGQKYMGDLQAVPDRMTLGLGSDRIVYVNSSLMDRAANNPIATGGQVVGLLIVMFPKLDKDFFKGKTPRFEVKFRDVKQHEYSVSIRPTGERAKAGHVSGMSEVRQLPQGTSKNSELREFVRV